MAAAFNLVGAIEAVFEIGMQIVSDVRAARDRSSDGGRKITGPEWRRIVARASAKLAIGLTEVFAADLEDDAVGSFSDAPPRATA